MLSAQENLQYQRAHAVFLETKRRKAALPEKDKRLFRQLERVEIGRYNVTSSVILMIADVYQNNAIDAFDTIFSLGFMKGQRAEKARQKKEEGESLHGEKRRPNLGRSRKKVYV